MDNKEQKRFTSKAEITPVNPFEENSSNQTPHEPAANNKSTPSTVRHIPITTETPFGSAHRVASPSRFSNSRATPAQECYQSPRSGRKVHYIPIYVEGSEKPVVPKNIEEPVEQKSFASAEQKSFASAESAPSKRPSDACSFGSSVPTPSSAASSKPQSTPFSHHEREVPIQVETPVSAASAPQSPPPPPPPPQRTPPAKPDPLKQVQDVQQEVDSLTRRVEQFCGTSRADKDYLFLDEMLTRNLIKLDIIEVAGNEVLRVARKNVIKCIQQAIALLESKVPAKEGDQGSVTEPPATPMELDEASVVANSDDVPESQNQTPNTAASSETPAPTDANEGGARVENGEKTN